MSRHTDTLATFTAQLSDDCHTEHVPAGWSRTPPAQLPSVPRRLPPVARVREAHCPKLSAALSPLRAHDAAPSLPLAKPPASLPSSVSPPARQHGLVYSCEAAALRGCPLSASASSRRRPLAETSPLASRCPRLPWHHLHKPKRRADVSAGRPTSTRSLQVPVSSAAFHPPPPLCPSSPRRAHHPLGRHARLAEVLSAGLPFRRSGGGGCLACS